MNKKNCKYIYILLPILIVCTICRAQEWSVKPYLHYHYPTASQTEPVFNIVELIAYQATVLILQASSFSENFTLADGMEYGLAVNYRFPNRMGVELGADYFSAKNRTFLPVKYIPARSYIITRPEKYPEQIIYSPTPCTTLWNYHSLAIRPLFTFAVERRKSAFIIKAGPTLHISDASMSASYNEAEAPFNYTFDTKWNLGCSGALEYDYQLLKQMGLFAELGWEWYKYTPEETRKKSIIFNSLYFGMGIKLNILSKFKK
jgi:hypothetical protein